MFLELSGQLDIIISIGFQKNHKGFRRVILIADRDDRTMYAKFRQT